MPRKKKFYGCLSVKRILTYVFLRERCAAMFGARIWSFSLISVVFFWFCWILHWFSLIFHWFFIDFHWFFIDFSLIFNRFSVVFGCFFIDFHWFFIDFLYFAGSHALRPVWRTKPGGVANTLVFYSGRKGVTGRRLNAWGVDMIGLFRLYGELRVFSMDLWRKN